MHYKLTLWNGRLVYLVYGRMMGHDHLTIQVANLPGREPELFLSNSFGWETNVDILLAKYSDYSNQDSAFPIKVSNCHLCPHRRRSIIT